MSILTKTGIWPGQVSEETLSSRRTWLGWSTKREMEFAPRMRAIAASLGMDEGATGRP